MEKPDDPAKRSKSRLNGLKRSQRFIDYRHSFDFALELESLLSNIANEVTDPKAGLDLVAAFYKCDDSIFERCDDSSGRIGDVFRLVARDHFIDYAIRCTDKEFLISLLSDLLCNDNYGIRGELIDAARHFLPEELLRRLADKFWEHAKKEPEDSSQFRHWLSLVQSLARQLKDAPFYEEMCKAYWGDLPVVAHYDIAEVYLDAGDALTALGWIEHVPESEGFRADRRDQLLLAIFRKIGNQDRLAETAWRIFRRYRSTETLTMLLAIIGPEMRDEVVEAETKLILESEMLSYSDCRFLIEVGRMEDAESYLFCHIAQLDGQFYPELLKLADSMEKDERFIAATVIYRALLDYILKRAISKYYHYGIKYLNKLDRLAGKITEWKDIQPHLAYREELFKKHTRKASFWRRYKGDHG